MVPCDLTKSGEPEQLVAAAIEHYGRLDIVVNNAGASEPIAALEESTDHFRASLELNLVAPFEVARAAASFMVDNGGGSIVNVASIWGLVGVGQIPEAGYAAAKGRRGEPHA